MMNDNVKSIPPSRIAITGATGYIGSYLANFLQKRHYEIYKMGRHKDRASNIPFIQFELGKVNDYTALQGIDCLIHCAYDFSPIDYQMAKKINLDGSIDLFQNANRYGVNKIIYISTTSAFKNAISNYGRIKYELETQARQFNATIIRPGLVFNENPGGIVGALNRLVMKSSVVPIIGKGDQKFYPCHIEDLAFLLEYLFDHDIHDPIIAASEKVVTFKNIVTTLAQVHNKKCCLMPLPYEFIYLALKTAELLKIRTRMRSDSLKYMRYSNKNIDFSITRKSGIIFRPFDANTLLNC